MCRVLGGHLGICHNRSSGLARAQRCTGARQVKINHHAFSAHGYKCTRFLSLRSCPALVRQSLSQPGGRCGRRWHKLVGKRCDERLPQQRLQSVAGAASVSAQAVIRCTSTVTNAKQGNRAGAGVCVCVWGGGGELTPARRGIR